MTNQAMIITKVKNIYIMLLHAISNENMSIVDHYVDDDLIKKIGEIIEKNKSNNIKQVFRQQNISNVVILEDDGENLTIQADVKYISYFVNRENNEYVGGDKQNRTMNRIILKFRKNNIETRSIFHCPSCGAALKINATGICDYCGRALDERFSHYVLYEIK